MGTGLVILLVAWCKSRSASSYESIIHWLLPFRKSRMARFLKDHPFTYIFCKSFHCLAASAASRKTISSDTRLFLSKFGKQPVYAHSSLPFLSRPATLHGGPVECSRSYYCRPPARHREHNNIGWPYFHVTFGRRAMTFCAHCQSCAVPARVFLGQISFLSCSFSLERGRTISGSLIISTGVTHL